MTEAELLRLLEEEFDGQLDEILDLLGDPPDLSKIPSGFWDGLTASMVATLRPVLEKAALAAAERIALEPGIGVDWALVAEDAAQWASTYSYKLVTGNTDTTQRVLQESVERFIREPGRTIGDLTADLEPYFGKMRAEMISVTEATRAFSEGERLTVTEWQKYGARLQPIWNTNRDELVCDICREKGKRGEITDGEYPPAHPRCRCWPTHRSMTEKTALRAAILPEDWSYETRYDKWAIAHPKEAAEMRESSG